MDGSAQADKRLSPVMLKRHLNIPLIPNFMRRCEAQCEGCMKTMPAGALVEHAPRCPKWAGAGSAGRRHTLAKYALARTLRERGVNVEIEVPVRVRPKPGKPIPPALKMDLVVGKRWFDVTITIDELKRFRQKEKTYGQAAKDWPNSKY